jgi:hypothetical protein
MQFDALRVGRELVLRASHCAPYIIPLAMLAIALMLIAAALWL